MHLHVCPHDNDRARTATVDNLGETFALATVKTWTNSWAAPKKTCHILNAVDGDGLFWFATILFAFLIVQRLMLIKANLIKVRDAKPRILDSSATQPQRPEGSKIAGLPPLQFKSMNQRGKK